MFICFPSKAQYRYDNLPDAAQLVNEDRKWDHTDLTYFFQNGTPDIAGSSEKQAFRDAFALWAGVTPLTFTEVSTASAADIIILFAAGAHGDGYAFDGPAGTFQRIDRWTHMRYV